MVKQVSRARFGMVVDIETRRLRTIVHQPLADDLRAFVEGNEAVDFQPQTRDEPYGFVRGALQRFDYRSLRRRDNGAKIRFPGRDGHVAPADRARRAAVARNRRRPRSTPVRGASSPDLKRKALQRAYRPIFVRLCWT